MNVFRSDRVVFIKDYDNSKLIVGETYEVANITDSSIVLRNVKNKVAVASIAIDEFDQHFKKANEVTGWTRWIPLALRDANITAFYRTNGKKVQVRIGVGGKVGNRSMQGEASCMRDDEFNLMFGLQLAYLRCENKYLNNEKKKYEKKMSQIKESMGHNNVEILNMLNSLDNKNKKGE